MMPASNFASQWARRAQDDSPNALIEAYEGVCDGGRRWIFLSKARHEALGIAWGKAACGGAKDRVRLVQKKSRAVDGLSSSRRTVSRSYCPVVSCCVRTATPTARPATRQSRPAPPHPAPPRPAPPCPALPWPALPRPAPLCPAPPHHSLTTPPPLPPRPSHLQVRAFTILEPSQTSPITEFQDLVEILDYLHVNCNAETVYNDAPADNKPYEALVDSLRATERYAPMAISVLNIDVITHDTRKLQAGALTSALRKLFEVCAYFPDEAARVSAVVSCMRAVRAGLVRVVW